MNEKTRNKIIKSYENHLADEEDLAGTFSLINHDHFNEGNCTSVKYHPMAKLASLVISNMCFDIDEDGRLVNFPRPVSRAEMELCFLTSEQLRKFADLLNHAADDMDVLNSLA